MVQGAQSIARAIAIVRTVAQLQRSGATLARVAQMTGQSKSTAFRILRALTAERLLAFDDQEGRYWIGPLAYELGLAAPRKDKPQDEWHEAVDKVARRTGLTSYLMARSGDEAVCLLCVQAAAAVRAVPFDVGQRVPLGFGAGSFAILASLDEREVEHVLAAHRRRFDPMSSYGRTLPGLANRIASTRRQGYALSIGTIAPGVTGIGVVVPRNTAPASLAITISAATEDMSAREARFLADCIEALVG